MASTGEVWKLGHRPALDGLRGIAVLLVVAYHAGIWVENPAGIIGVAMFFTLSGFLITRLILEAREAGRWSFRQFIGNRAARLLPALIVMVAFMTGLSLVAGDRPGYIFPRTASALFYVQNVWNSGGPFAHAWSLAVEEQFYLLWPLALGAVLVSRRPMVWVLGVAVVSAGLRLDEAWRQVVPDGYVASHYYALLFGCALAFVAPRLSRAPRGVGVVAWAALVALVAGGPILPAPAYTGEILASLVTTGILWASLADGCQVLAWPPLRFAGRISYSLYLWHFPLLVVTGTMGAGAWALPTVAVSVIVATCSTVLFEEPVRRWWRRGSDRDRRSGRLVHVGN